MGAYQLHLLDAALYRVAVVAAAALAGLLF